MDVQGRPDRASTVLVRPADLPENDRYSAKRQAGSADFGDPSACSDRGLGCAVVELTYAMPQSEPI